VVAALGVVRSSTGDTLRDLSDRIGDRASRVGASGPRPPIPERSEAFIVRISLAADGQAIRSTVTHVRTQTEKPSAGWSRADVIRFIEEHSSMGAAAPLTAGDTVHPARVRAPAPAPSVKPAPAWSASRDHVVVLDAGKAIGGARRDIELVVETSQVAHAEFEYRATLAGRSYGHATQPAPSWTTLARRTGRASPPDRLPLRFEAVELPHGVQRLRLEVAMRLPTPKERTPSLALA
jgi:hypothetical protein